MKNNFRGRDKKGHFTKEFKHSMKSKIKIGMANKGEKHPNWNGGRHKLKVGYVVIYAPNHPFKIDGAYIYEHRLVIEKHIGRVLLPTEVVHHINGIRDDNRIENLMLFSNDSEHKKYHFPKGCRKGKKNPNYKNGKHIEKHAKN